MHKRVALLSALAAAAFAAFGLTGPAAASSTMSQSACIAHHSQEFVWYTSSCTGHDEPEIDPLSNKPGSAQDLTWTIVLPTNGAASVESVGPTFWIGGTVTDRTASSTKRSSSCSSIPTASRPAARRAEAST